MYDNVDSYLPLEKCGMINLLDTIPNYLTNIKRTSYENDELLITGYLDNMKVQVSKNRIKIKENSICKWYFGNNLETLTLENFRDCIEKLSDLLHLPIENSIVTRIDIANNFIVNNVPSKYFSYLGDLNRFQRFEFGSSLYYNQTKGQLNFYDKIKDCRAKKMDIPLGFQNENVLRYERRFKHDLKHKFNRAIIDLKTLCEFDFYKSIIGIWHSDYSNIYKIQVKDKLDFKIVNTITELNMQALIILIEKKGGLLDCLSEVNEAQKNGELTRKQASDFRNKYKEANSNKLYFDETDLAMELTRKIDYVAQNII